MSRSGASGFRTTRRRKTGYPQFNEKVKRQILGLSSATLLDSLKATLNYPGFSRPGSRHPSNRRYGWIHR